MTLLMSGLEPSNVFALRGLDENSATTALGWTLDRCPRFFSALIMDLVREDAPADAFVELQRSDDDRGLTDIEIVSENRFHIIIEAKVGWAVPSAEQLGRYGARLKRTRGD